MSPETTLSFAGQGNKWNNAEDGRLRRFNEEPYGMWFLDMVISYVMDRFIFKATSKYHYEYYYVSLYKI